MHVNTAPPPGDASAIPEQVTPWILATGRDSLAGPHRHTPTPATTSEVVTGLAPARRQPPTQLALPDIDAAITQLTRAVTTSGRERAAHALLDAPVHAARENAWARQEAARPPEEFPREHLNNQGDLDRARIDRDHAQQRLQQAAARMRELEAELAHTGIFGRKRRAELTTAITRTAKTSSPAPSAGSSLPRKS